LCVRWQYTFGESLNHCLWEVEVLKNLSALFVRMTDGDVYFDTEIIALSVSTAGRSWSGCRRFSLAIGNGRDVDLSAGHS